MRRDLISAAVLALAALGVSPAAADDGQLPPDRAYLTFACPTRLPGTQLAPGTYLFVIARAVGGQALVDIYTADASQHVARVLGIERRGVREWRTQPQVCTDAPIARRGWSHGVSGIEFVYSQTEAAQLSLAFGVPVAYSTIPTTDPEMLGAYPVAGLTPFAPLLVIGAGAPVALGDPSRLALLIAAAGATFGPQDHLTAARIIVAERARGEARERAMLRQLGIMLDNLQRSARGNDHARTARLARGIEATAINLCPPADLLAAQGMLPPPREFVLTMERVGAHVRAYRRRALVGAQRD